MNEYQREHEKKMAKIKARSDAFLKAPWAFTFWDIVTTVINGGFWIGVWFIFAQCSCSGCLTK